MMTKVSERYYLLIIIIFLYHLFVCTNPVKVGCFMEDREKTIGLTML